MTIFHWIGDLIRDALALIPLLIVRATIIAMLFALLLWVLALPKRATTPPGRGQRWTNNLKIWAALAVIVQIAIYVVL